MFKNKNPETFNDGILNVLEVKDREITKTLVENIYYGNKTIGVNRFFNAKVAGSTVSKLIAIPFNYFVKRDNLVELTDFRTGITEIFKIAMLQEKFDSFPESIYLTLERTEIKYVDNRTISTTNG